MSNYEIVTSDFDKLLNNMRRRTVGFQLAPWINTAQVKYPPYDIEQVDENTWNVTVAVAGFKTNEIGVTEDKDILIITGHKEEDTAERNYTHKGIATRDIDLKIQMGEHTHVENATCEDGLLIVKCVRDLPEELKPRLIEIKRV